MSHLATNPVSLAVLQMCDSVTPCCHSMALMQAVAFSGMSTINAASIPGPRELAARA